MTTPPMEAGAPEHAPEYDEQQRLTSVEGLAALALITGLNLWGVSESAKVFTVPTVLFVVAIVAVILGGLVRTQPAVPLDHHVGAATEAAGALLLLKAFASGCSTGRTRWRRCAESDIQAATDS